MEFLIYVIGFLILITIGVVFGTMADRRHIANLNKREAACEHVLRTQSRNFIEPTGKLVPNMFCAEAVIANDYYKRFRASFRSFFGGEIKGYNVLMDRARRETVLKIIEQANAHGYNAICNLRLESADVGGNLSRQGMSIVCIVGTATAYHTNIGRK